MITSSKHRHNNVTEILLTHSRSGLQIMITESKDGFILSPGVAIRFERFDNLTWQVNEQYPEVQNHR